MQTITITRDGDSIQVSIEEDGQPAGKPYACTSVEECITYVENALSEEASPADAQEDAQQQGPEDYKAAWDQEATKRPMQPGLMA
jgi:hypothetical protein